MNENLKTHKSLWDNYEVNKCQVGLAFSFVNMSYREFLEAVVEKCSAEQVLPQAPRKYME